MRNKELYDKEIILLESNYADGPSSDSIGFCAEIEATMLKIISENEYLMGINDRKNKFFTSSPPYALRLHSRQRARFRSAFIPTRTRHLYS